MKKNYFPNIFFLSGVLSGNKHSLRKFGKKSLLCYFSKCNFAFIVGVNV